MKGIRVLVVDDHEMVAQGLVGVLASMADIEVVGMAGTVRDATQLAAHLAPDVVVMDYRLPDGDGVTATAALRREQPDTAVVMVTASTHDTVIAAAIEAGCVAFVSKTRAAKEVVAAVRAAARGDVAFPASALARLQTTGASGRARTLTPRELEVLQLLAEGASTGQVAERLFLSPSTVRNHVQNVLTKLDVHSKLEAVTTAVREGIVDIPG